MTSHPVILYIIVLLNSSVALDRRQQLRKMTTHLNLKKDCLWTLLSLLALHIGTCQAQSSSSSGFVAIPVVIFVAMATFMCVCFWTCFFYQRSRQRQYYGAATTTQYTYNPQRPYYGVGTQPYPAQRYVVPSTAPSNPPPTQSYPVQQYVAPSTAPGNPPPTQPYPVQGYFPPSTVTVPNAPPAPPGVTSQTVPQASEPVSLPEATLHQGDAPPAYNEAIGMRTVDIVDQDKQQ